MTYESRNQKDLLKKIIYTYIFLWKTDAIIFLMNFLIEDEMYNYNICEYNEKKNDIKRC